ncbi:hypothetical protein EV701_13725 [Chthoniobacter flavus]|nr:hypothetical protein EV701_13725 [Chthoniobacter flavus]
MLAILAMLFFLSACVIAALNFTAVMSRNVVSSNSYRRGTEVGDGCMEYMYSQWRQISKKLNNAPATADLSGIALPTADQFPSVPNFSATTTVYLPNTKPPKTVSAYGIVATDPQGNPLSNTSLSPTTVDSTGVSPNLAYGTDPSTSSAYYLATADITVPAFAGRTFSVRMCRVFERQVQSMWKYAIFYNDMLEINPGANQTITGWVHTNDSLYTAYADLTFNNKVDYVNDWGSKNFAPGDKDHTSVTPASPTWPSNLPPARGEYQYPLGVDPSQTFLNTTPNDIGFREFIMPPTSGYADPIADTRYYDQAAIRIMVDASGAVTISKGDGTVLTSSSKGTDANLYTAYSSAVKTGDSFTDNREGAVMGVTTLDVGKIYSATTAATNPIPNPQIIYISDTSNSSSSRKAIRLKNGSFIPSGGLTIASQNAVYIQGDYNTGQTSSHQTPANTNNNGTGGNLATKSMPDGSNYTEQPSAVLADAVNILSNAWKDANSTQDVSSGNRKATPTTVNAAFVSGNVPTGSGGTGANSYSGGAENFPRFLEDWGSQTFTYYGSMVELFKSAQSTGYWGNGNVYSPPKRNWNFDTLFYTHPPPGSFFTVTYNKQRWYTR